VGWMALSTVACCAFYPCDRVRPAAPAHRLVEQLPVVAATSPDLCPGDRLSDEVVAYLHTVTKRIDEHLTLYRSISRWLRAGHCGDSLERPTRDKGGIRCHERAMGHSVAE
jgi:hypothetical protein